MWLFLQQAACKCFMEVIATSSGEMKIDQFFFMRKREATCNSKYLLQYLLTENLYYRSFSWRYLPYVELYWATLEKKKKEKKKKRKRKKEAA